MTHIWLGDSSGGNETAVAPEPAKGENGLAGIGARLWLGQGPAWIALIAVVYFLGHWIAFRFLDPQKVLTLVWPAGGIGLAALLLSPRALWPTIAAVLFAVDVSANRVLGGQPFLVGLGFGVANLLETLGCAGLMARWGGSSVRFARVREVLALLVGAVAVNALTAGWGAAVAGFYRDLPFWNSWMLWYVSDGFGLLLVTPLVVTWADGLARLRGWTWVRAVELAVFALVWCAVAWVAFEPGVSIGVMSPQPYMLVALLAWTALRFGPRGVTVAILILTVIAITSTAVVRGPLPWGSYEPAKRLLVVQIYLAFAAASGLLLAAVYAEAVAVRENLRHTGELLGSVLANTFTMAAFLDIRFRFVWVNRAFAATCSREPSFFRGRRVFDLFPDPENQALFQRVADTGEAFSGRTGSFVLSGSPGNESVRCDWSLCPTRDSQGGVNGLVLTLFDVTERIRAENELRESEERLRIITDNTPDHVFMQDAELRYTLMVNPPFGLSDSDVLGRTDYELVSSADADRLTHIKRRILETGDAIHIEIPLTSPTGEQQHFEGSYIPRRSAEGRVDGLIGYFRNVTERKRMESDREKLQAQLAHSHRIESVGRLAGGIAHDYNNMLTVILWHVEAAARHVDASQPIYSDLVQIRDAAERSADLTRRLLAFARKQTVKPKVIDLNETVEAMLAMLQPLIGENIKLTCVPAGEPVWVRIDPSQIDQILINLCVNARDAIAGTGEIAIEVGAATLDADHCGPDADSGPGDYAWMTVADSGCGMSRDTLDRLFEPFFTTKAVGKGTGMGLATVHGIVKQNGGFVKVSSEVGRGTMFKVCLPRHHEGARTELAAPPEETGPPVPGTVLVVEDEEAILRMIDRMLQREGYTVLAAASPTEAIRVADEYAGDIHLLLTDVVMPEMDGRELAARIQAGRPRLECLFMSGYAANVIAEQGLMDEGISFLPKPFSMAELLAKLGEILPRR